MNPNAVKIYVDGSCQKNPSGPGGIAGIVEIPDDENNPEIIFQDGYKSTTNNRMEILAIINSLEYVKKNLDKFKAKSFTEIEILSDSETAIKCYKLADTWRSHDWLGVYENPIKNVDLLKRIITLKNSVKFNCRPYWVLNKSSEITQQVDKLAKAASKRIILKDDIGYIEPRICKTEVKGKTEKFDAQGQEIIIRIFSHVPISTRKKAQYEIKFEIQSDDKKEKYRAYASQEINALLDKWHYYNTKFNNNPNNPKIEKVEEVTEKEFLAQCE